MRDDLYLDGLSGHLHVNGLLQLLDVGHAATLESVRLGKRNEVGSVRQRGLGILLIVDERLPLAHHAKRLVVEYEGNDQLESSVKSTHIYVSKISSFKFDIVTNEPYVGENLTVDIQLPTDSTGKVNVTVSIPITEILFSLLKQTVFFIIWLEFWWVLR